MPHCSQVPVPTFSSLPDLALGDSLFEATDETDSDCSTYSDSLSAAAANLQTTEVKPFVQSQLKDIVRAQLC